MLKGHQEYFVSPTANVVVLCPHFQSEEYHRGRSRLTAYELHVDLYFADQAELIPLPVAFWNQALDMHRKPRLDAWFSRDGRFLHYASAPFHAVGSTAVYTEQTTVVATVDLQRLASAQTPVQRALAVRFEANGHVAMLASLDAVLAFFTRMKQDNNSRFAMSWCILSGSTNLHHGSFSFARCGVFCSRSLIHC